METALRLIESPAAPVRQHACDTIGQGAKLSAFAPAAGPSLAVLARLLQKNSERYRRRRAVKSEDKESFLAVDSAIRAVGLICEHHEQHLGNDATRAWQMWLGLLPLKYDHDEGREAHQQLL